MDELLQAELAALTDGAAQAAHHTRIRGITYPPGIRIAVNFSNPRANIMG
jgi:hypothetical protein